MAKFKEQARAARNVCQRLYPVEHLRRRRALILRDVQLMLAPLREDIPRDVVNALMLLMGHEAGARVRDLLKIRLEDLRILSLSDGGDDGGGEASLVVWQIDPHKSTWKEDNRRDAAFGRTDEPFNLHRWLVVMLKAHGVFVVACAQGDNAPRHNYKIRPECLKDPVLVATRDNGYTCEAAAIYIIEQKGYLDVFTIIRNLANRCGWRSQMSNSMFACYFGPAIDLSRPSMHNHLEGFGESGMFLEIPAELKADSREVERVKAKGPRSLRHDPGQGGRYALTLAHHTAGHLVLAEMGGERVRAASIVRNLAARGSHVLGTACNQMAHQSKEARGDRKQHHRDRDIIRTNIDRARVVAAKEARREDHLPHAIEVLKGQI